MRSTRRRGGYVRDIDEVSGDVLDVSFRLHRELGPGLLETVYEVVLAAKLQQMGYEVARQEPVGINFGGATLKEGVRRVVNGHKASACPRLRVNKPSSGA